MKIVFKAIMFLMCLNAYAANDYLAIVSNVSAETTEISQDTLYNIFLLSARQWDNGVPIIIVMLPEDNLQTQLFVEEYLGISVASYRRRTSNAYATGRASKPIVVSSELEALSVVNKTRGGVCYVEGTLYINDENDNLVKIVIK
jgi:hypothetical protein